MFKRQKILLSLLLNAPKVPTSTELMKWLFLLKYETPLSNDNTFYDFLPYKYGPFSFTVYRDLNELTRIGFLIGGEGRIHSSFEEKAQQEYQTLTNKIKEYINIILGEYANFSQKDLVNVVYEKYPWFACRSDLTKYQVTHPNTLIAVYTAGYENQSIDSFFNKLLGAGIKRFIDVRHNPLSRKYGFSKQSLERLCDRLDIEYMHVPEVGVPPSFRVNLKTFEDYQKLMQEYEASILPTVSQFKNQISKMIKEMPSVLVCFEADVRCCHRGRLARAIAQDTGIEMNHLS